MGKKQKDESLCDMFLVSSKRTKFLAPWTLHRKLKVRVICFGFEQTQKFGAMDFFISY